MVLLDPPTPASVTHADAKAKTHRAIKPTEKVIPLSRSSISYLSSCVLDRAHVWNCPSERSW
jgi:hypothetical protein